MYATRHNSDLGVRRTMEKKDSAAMVEVPSATDTSKKDQSLGMVT